MAIETVGDLGPRDVLDGPIVAIVEDELMVSTAMRRLLASEGYRVTVYDSAEAVLAEPTRDLSAMCLDLNLPDGFGLDVLAELLSRDPDLPVIIATAVDDVAVAVLAIRAGAYDYVVKPIRPEGLLHALRRAVERRALSDQVRALRSATVANDLTLVGASAPMREIARQIDRVRDSDVTVCILGESGSGKELVAHAIHAGSRRRDRAFVAINCAAIAPNLQESELFGHEPGAFTGAVGLHRGRFEQAHGGTLFLDELAEMNHATQATLLRVLQNRTIQRLKGTREIPVNVRVISATHRDLEAEVRAGRFREDLYYRLMVYPIQLPPLRTRTEDIPALVATFLQKYAHDVGREIRRVSPEVLDALARAPWPGNVRELENVVHRAMLSCDGPELILAHLPPVYRGRPSSDPPIPALPSIFPSILPPAAAVGVPAVSPPSRVPPPPRKPRVQALRDIEEQAIQDALSATEGSVPRAAKLLGMSRATLYRRISTMDSIPAPRSPDGTTE